MLQGTGLTKKFGDNVALDNVEIAIHPGKITVLLGPSGSGKTTLLRALSLLEPADSGRIKLDNIEYQCPITSGFISPSPWPTVTVVFQQFFLWPHLTLKDNILLPLRNRAIDATEALAHVSELFGMSEFIERYPNQVSAGQRQRAALARAIVLQPRYILLDEITSSLDIEQSSIIYKFLISLREQGIGMLVVTHSLGFAARLMARQEGDQVAFMDRGRVLETGGKTTLDQPQTERFQRFLAMAENAW